MRKVCLKLAGLLLFLLVALMPATAFASDWPQFQKDLYNSGLTSDSAPVTLPDFAWKQRAGYGAGMGAGIDVAPLVAGDGVFVIDAQGKAWLFNAKTGVNLWSQQLSCTNQRFQLATPAYDSGWLYVATNDGHVYKLSNTDGGIAWNTALPITHRYDQLNTTVKYDDGKVYVGAWAPSSTRLEYFYCLNASDGSPGIGADYRMPNTASYGGYYWAGACIVDNYMIFGSDKAVLACLDKGTGALISSVDLKTIESAVSFVRSSVSYDPAAGMLFLTDEKGWCWAFDFNASTGAIAHRWHYSTGYSTSTPTIYNGMVYVGSGSAYGTTGTVYCLNEETGSPLWSYNAGGAVESSPAISIQNGVPYIYFSINSSNSAIVCLDQGGNQVWKYTEQEPVGSGRYTLQGVAISDGWLYFGNDAGWLYALKPPVVHVTGVTLDKETDEICAGNTSQLAATVSPPDATDQSVTWSSGNEAVATVDASGLVTALAEGTASITVTTTDGGYTDTCEVTVQSCIPEPPGVESSPVPSAEPSYFEQWT